MLQLELDALERRGIEQLAQLRLAEKLAELGLVDCQRLRAALGERRVAVVDEIRDVTEQQRAGERRRLLRVGGDHADRALANLLHRRHERRHVKDVAQTLAIRLEDNRERAEP